MLGGGDQRQENQDNCNSTINKIYLKNLKNIKLWSQVAEGILVTSST